ncbi:DUF4347 domain-containing protein, partial [Argonema antarcticum]|uniref:DUF4347 domain-containing protein n=1 Tax=Argonema antarcticum TaxID=2942763 RepID=UPI002012E7F5
MPVQNSAVENLNPQAAQGNAIAFIDTSVQDWQTLAAGVTPGTEVILLDGTRDGVAQITQILQTRSNIAALHIISHGSPGEVQLGNGTLNSGNLDNYTNSLKQWRNALTENADILIYGCNVAGDPPQPPFLRGGLRDDSEPPFLRGGLRDDSEPPFLRGGLRDDSEPPFLRGAGGISFLHRLHHLTKANIAASKTPTGNAALGGDWELEVKIGHLTAPIAITKSARIAYKGILPGDLIWAKGIGGSGDEIGYSIAVDSSGNTYTTGYFSGTADFDPGAGTANLTPAGGADIFITK